MNSSNLNDRVNENNEFERNRKLQNFEINEIIDVLDSENIWCKGKIIDILKNDLSINLKIHYLGWNSLYDEIINKDSIRVAKLGFFTSRQSDLSRYSKIYKSFR